MVMPDTLKQGFLKSWGMILASEIGDKTFFIAAIMAMKHSRVTVFSGALAALSAMTALSAVMGWAAPNLVRSVQGMQAIARVEQCLSLPHAPCRSPRP